MLLISLIPERFAEVLCVVVLVVVRLIGDFPGLRPMSILGMLPLTFSGAVFAFNLTNGP